MTIDTDKILIHLDGFIIVEDGDESPEDISYNKIVTSDELDEFYEIAEANARSYLGVDDSIELNDAIITFVYMWAAGLIYKKYVIRENDLIDEDQTIGYGDNLIINAKVGLKPYKVYSFTVW